MQRINEDLRSGQFKQAYLLYGEEAYLRRQYRDRLKKALLGDGDAMNMNCFEGKDVNVGEVIDVAETMPFLRTGGLSSWTAQGFLRAAVKSWRSTLRA